MVFNTLTSLSIYCTSRTVVAARGDCELGNDFCSPDHLYLIRMYSVLVGDVDLEYFETSNAMLAVFVFFSLFSIIILLNILIAIIIDTYERSKQRSREIFYMARINYAAHLVARHQFFTPMKGSDFQVAKRVPRMLRQGLHWVYRLIICFAVLMAEIGLFGAVDHLITTYGSGYHVMTVLLGIYGIIGTVFNLYALSVAAIALNGRLNVGRTYGKSTRMTWIPQKIVQLLYWLLGFNENRVDISDKFVITAEEDK